MKKSIIMIFILLSVRLFSLEIEGRLFRADNSQPLSDQTLMLKGEGIESPIITKTLKDGAFKFEDLKEGLYELEVKAIGFYPEKKTIKLTKNARLTFYLSPLPTASLGEVEVKGEREKIVASKTTVDKKTIEKASASITGDPLEVVKKMPGVESDRTWNLTTAAKISIRGGQGYETIGLIDDIQLNYFYHRIIPDSVFIDDLIEEISLYKGVAPVEYGQLMSGMLNVKTIKPPVGVHGKANLGLLNTYLTLYGSTEDEKWQFLGV